MQLAPSRPTRGLSKTGNCSMVVPLFLLCMYVELLVKYVENKVQTTKKVRSLYGSYYQGETCA
jgi:hypothetical protein